MDRGPDRDETIPAHLSVWDAVSIIVGIVIGAGIFQTPPLIFKNLPGPGAVVIVWVVAGLLCLVGALCYAELGTSYPRAGGDYVYLTRAYGRWLGFLFGWAQVGVILTANIGMMAYVFADYASRLFLGQEHYKKSTLGWLWAGSAVVVLTALNILGLRAGKLTQNILTTIKVVGLSAIIVVGLTWPSPSANDSLADLKGFGLAAGALATGETANLLLKSGSVGFALVLAFFTYGGWNDSAYVAAEVKNGRRNIPRALILGISLIILIYVLVNLAYLNSLGYAGARGSHAIAADVLSAPFGVLGEQIMCVLVMLSALGAANGLIFTASRVALALGRDHPIFSWLGHWHARRETPYVALLTQAGISVGLILLVGTSAGQELMNFLLTRVMLKPVDWLKEGVLQGGFETLLKCTAPLFWLFFLLTGISLFVLREQQRHGSAIQRPFSVPFYPYLPLVFCATCGYMVLSGLDYAGSLGYVGGVLVLLGFPLYEISEWMARRRPIGTSAVLAGAPSVNHDPPAEAIQPDGRSITRRETP